YQQGNISGRAPREWVPGTRPHWRAALQTPEGSNVGAPANPLGPEDRLHSQWECSPVVHLVTSALPFLPSAIFLSASLRMLHQCTHSSDRAMARPNRLEDAVRPRRGDPGCQTLADLSPLDRLLYEEAIQQLCRASQGTEILRDRIP